MRLHLAIAVLGVVLSFLAFEARSEWVRATGAYSFGPELSEEVACRRAERRAKDNALKQLQGERLTSDDMLICKEQESQADCNMNRFTWSTINGLISGLRDVVQETSV